MKRYAYPALAVLMALSLAAAGVGLALLPDTVPVHWSFAGEADRMGSKLEFLIFPAVMAVSGGIFALAARRCGKKGDREALLTETILLASAFFEVLLFTGIALSVMWQAGHYAPGAAGPAVSPDLFRFIGIGTGVLLVLLGNYMPKARRNAFFGVRTRWSMADDETWRRSQRFGGISAVALGFVFIVAGLFLGGVAHLVLCVAGAAVWAGACVGMSYRYSKQTA
ncbi:MAG: SdpI family protein [Roseburia sp.]|nr:SdpI family protein [Roseburia sp.]